jgi:hypothetical protein
MNADWLLNKTPARIGDAAAVPLRAAMIEILAVAPPSRSTFGDCYRTGLKYRRYFCSEGRVPTPLFCPPDVNEGDGVLRDDLLLVRGNHIDADPA